MTSSSSATVSASSLSASAASGSEGTASTTAVPVGSDAASTAWFDVLGTNMLVPQHDLSEANRLTSPSDPAAGDKPTRQAVM